MVPLILLITFCALGWLALRYGYDSTRTEAVSKEEHLARFGMTWERDVRETTLPRADGREPGKHPLESARRLVVLAEGWQGPSRN